MKLNRAGKKAIVRSYKKSDYQTWKTAYFPTVLLLLLVIHISACTLAPKRDYTFIEIPETINKDPDKILSEQEVEYDIAQTIYALNTAYSGKKFLPKGEFRTLIQNIEPLKAPYSAAELCEKIDSYMDAVSDNHLNAKFNNKPCFKSPNGRDGKVGKNFYFEKNDIPWKVRLSHKSKKNALLISITGFPKSTSPVWRGFIDTVKKQLPQADLVILDMRGNGGGDDSKGFELSALLAGTELKTPYAKQWNNPAPEAQQLFVNTFEYWARLDKEEGKLVPAYLLDLKKEFIQKRDRAVRGEKARDRESDEPQGHDFVLEKSIKRPIYILIDADCASSCESTTDFFENNPLVKTVGENTAGYVHFGNNGNVFLKNSGIKLQMAISYNSYTDGRFIEKIGIKPKIPVSAGEDAMEYAWQDFFKNN